MTLPDAFAWRQTAGGLALVCRALEPYAAHLFTTRRWTLGSAGDAEREPAWAEVGRALGAESVQVVRAHQVHGASVVVRRAGDRQQTHDTLPDADIIVSDDPALVLTIQTADCVPLLLADRRTGVVAAAHAGWRGLAAGVPKVTVDALAREFGSRPGDLIAAIGPAISAARYEVGDEVRARFEQAGFATAQLARWFAPAERARHWYFDGWTSIRDQLEAAGVPPDELHLSGLCTASDPGAWCSYRRDGKAAGRIAAAIRAR